MGLWHTCLTGNNPAGMLSSFCAPGVMGRAEVSPGLGVSPNYTTSELFHASIIYARPAGNSDPDVDPTNFGFPMLFARPETPSIGPMVQCRF